MWEKIDRPGGPGSWRGDIPIHHRYTMGVAGERFFRAMRDDRRLLASRCPTCREAFLPPKIYCERCFEETDRWVPVEGPGYVKTFTVLHISLEEESRGDPQVVAFIVWEGFRGGLVHRLGGIEAARVKTGIAVEPVWADQREGTLDDIHHFRPAG